MEARVTGWWPPPAQMDVHALTHIFSRFLAAFKLGAAHPDNASKAAAAVERVPDLLPEACSAKQHIPHFGFSGWR